MKELGFLMALAAMSSEGGPGSFDAKKAQSDMLKEVVRDVVRPALLKAGKTEEAAELDTMLKAADISEQLHQFTRFSGIVDNRRALDFLTDISESIKSYLREHPIDENKAAKMDTARKEHERQRDTLDAFFNDRPPYGPFGVNPRRRPPAEWGPPCGIL